MFLDRGRKKPTPEEPAGAGVIKTSKNLPFLSLLHKTNRRHDDSAEEGGKMEISILSPTTSRGPAPILLQDRAGLPQLFVQVLLVSC